jgi:hypothetical protein
MRAVRLRLCREVESCMPAMHREVLREMRELM